MGGHKIIVMMLTFALLSSLTPVYLSTIVNTNNEQDCVTLYFFNGIYVLNSQLETTLVLETPQNISVANGFKQFVYHVYSYMLNYNESTEVYEFSLFYGSQFYGFFLSKVIVCYMSYNKSLGYLKQALSDPRYKVGIDSIPDEIKMNYTKTPSSVVLERVVPEYESWFSRRYGYRVSEASNLGIAVTAAYFIMGEFIKYSEGTLPRSIEEVIETRRGDCDDMTRIVVELLSYYEIPAMMVYDYVYIPELGEINIQLENVTYLFVNNGPHAFPMAYIPGIGWLSLDFLAGSLLLYPAVIWGYTRETTVYEEDIKETVELHRSIEAFQVIGVYSEEYVLKAGWLNESNIMQGMKSLLDSYISKYSKNQTITTPCTTTPSSQSTTPTETSQAQDNPTSTFIEQTTRTEKRGSDPMVILIGIVIVQVVSLLIITHVIRLIKRQI
ncbi:MAG: transglutaminase-like domain-containing protein [Desulfurococcaceae archaeon]